MYYTIIPLNVRIGNINCAVYLEQLIIYDATIILFGVLFGRVLNF